VLTRAKAVLKAIESELLKHERAIEIDNTITKINVTVLISRRTGDPVKVLYNATSETDLTEKP
jgi:hypothetical protein